MVWHGLSNCSVAEGWKIGRSIVCKRFHFVNITSWTVHGRAWLGGLAGCWDNGPLNCVVALHEREKFHEKEGNQTSQMQARRSNNATGIEKQDEGEKRQDCTLSIVFYEKQANTNISRDTFVSPSFFSSGKKIPFHGRILYQISTTSEITSKTSSRLPLTMPKAEITRQGQGHTSRQGARTIKHTRACVPARPIHRPFSSRDGMGWVTVTDTNPGA